MSLPERLKGRSAHLINTLLQQGATGRARTKNRFNGLPQAGETVETVATLALATYTPLKQGVNEKKTFVGGTSDHKFRLGMIIAGALIRAYRLGLSPVLHFVLGPAAGCRFEPTCSEYALEAVTKHGAVRGGMLAARRICRCHPWGGCGHDPVPKELASSRLKAGLQTPVSTF